MLPTLKAAAALMGAVAVGPSNPAAAGAGGGAGSAAKSSADAKDDFVVVPVQPVRLGVQKAVVGLKRGVKPLRFTMPFSFSVTAATTGIVTGITSVLPDANTSEWAALAALYDEYKTHGGAVRFTLPVQSPQPGTAGLGPDNMFVMAWDPVDPTVLSSVRSGCELAQHKLLSPSLITSGVTDHKTAVFGFRCGDSAPFLFRWRTGPAAALAINSSGALNSTPGQWKLINAAGSNVPDGYLKVYTSVSATGSATAAVVGVVYIDVEFRSRK